MCSPASCSFRRRRQESVHAFSVELPIDHKTQQILINKKPTKQRIIGDSRINRSEHTINFYQTHWTQHDDQPSHI